MTSHSRKVSQTQRKVKVGNNLAAAKQLDGLLNNHDNSHKSKNAEGVDPFF